MKANRILDHGGTYLMFSRTEERSLRILCRSLHNVKGSNSKSDAFKTCKREEIERGRETERKEQRGRERNFEVLAHLILWARRSKLGGYKNRGKGRSLLIESISICLLRLSVGWIRTTYMIQDSPFNSISGLH